MNTLRTTTIRMAAAITAATIASSAPCADADAAVTHSLSSNGKTLKIVGDDGDNHAALSIVGDMILFSPTAGPDGLQTIEPANQIRKIKFVMKRGNDFVFVGNLGSTTNDRKIDIILGDGDDEVLIDFTGNNGAGIGAISSARYTQVRSELDITVKGGKGNDSVNASFPRVRAGEIDFDCKMGAGDDWCEANMYGDTVYGGEASFDLKGGNGDDNLRSVSDFDQYNDDGNVNVYDATSFSVRMDGGGGNDGLWPQYSGTVNGDLTYLINGQGNDDEAYVLLDLQPSSLGEVLALLNGSGGDDYLDLVILGSAASTSGAINGGGGADVCASTPGILHSNC